MSWMSLVGLDAHCLHETDTPGLGVWQITVTLSARRFSKDSQIRSFRKNIKTFTLGTNED